MKVHSIVILVVDTDEMGAERVKDTLEQQRYPNHCIGPKVVRIDTADLTDAEYETFNDGTLMTLEARHRIVVAKAAPEARPQPLPLSRWRHHRRESVYRVLGRIRVRLTEAEGWSDLVHYTDDDGKQYAQPPGLFRSKMKRVIRWFHDGVEVLDGRIDTSALKAQLQRSRRFIGDQGEE